MNNTDKQLDLLEKGKVTDVDSMFLECINDLNYRLDKKEGYTFDKKSEYFFAYFFRCSMTLILTYSVFLLAHFLGSEIAVASGIGALYFNMRQSFSPIRKANMEVPQR